MARLAVAGLVEQVGGLAVDLDRQQQAYDQAASAYAAASTQAPDVDRAEFELMSLRAEVAPMAPGSFKVDVKMTLTAPGCGMGPVLQQDVQNKLLGLEAVDDVTVELVWDPPWNQSMLSEAAKLQLGLV